MNYSRYISNKRVVFVGACPNLKGKGLGNKIDSYDVVIRSNHSWSFGSEDYKKDYGTKCDVLYINRQYYREMSPFPIEIMKKRGIKWLCMKGYSPSDYMIFSKYFFVRHIKEIINIVNKEVKGATMGSYILSDLLSCEPKEIYFTGIDFFASKSPKFVHNNYREYIEGYLPHKIVKQGNRINANKIEDGHNFNDNARFFKKLFNENKHLKTDNFIMEVLNNIVTGKIKQGQITWT